MCTDLTSRMKPVSDDEHYYPVGDCTTCGAKDVPFATMMLSKSYKTITYCLNCHSGEIVKPKGYVSEIDLEETEWSYEL